MARGAVHTPCQSVALLFARRNRRTARCDGQHDAETDRNQGSYREPDTRNLPEYPGLPEREPRAEEEHEIADEVNLQESHGETDSRMSADLVGGWWLVVVSSWWLAAKAGAITTNH